METTIQKWGNSLAVRLPKDLARKLKLHEGSAVLITQDDKRHIIIKHPPKKRKTSLADLISNISQTNVHQETKLGVRLGKEVW